MLVLPRFGASFNSYLLHFLIRSAGHVTSVIGFKRYVEDLSSLPVACNRLGTMSGPRASLVALNLEPYAWRSGIPPPRHLRSLQSSPLPFLCPRCNVRIHNMSQYMAHWKTRKHQRCHRNRIDRAAKAMRVIGVLLAEKWHAEEQYRKKQVLLRQVIWWVNQYFRAKQRCMGECDDTLALPP